MQNESPGYHFQVQISIQNLSKQQHPPRTHNFLAFGCLSHRYSILQKMVLREENHEAMFLLLKLSTVTTVCFRWAKSKHEHLPNVTRKFYLSHGMYSPNYITPPENNYTFLGHKQNPTEKKHKKKPNISLWKIAKTSHLEYWPCTAPHLRPSVHHGLSKAKEKTIWDEKDHIILGLKAQWLSFRKNGGNQMTNPGFSRKTIRRGTGHHGWFRGGLLILLKLFSLVLFLFIIYQYL